jgi:hypothetical protein
MERGHASPSEVLFMVVRVEGQIGAKDDIRVSQKVGRRIIGTEEAWVVGWARR